MEKYKKLVFEFGIPSKLICIIDSTLDINIEKGVDNFSDCVLIPYFDILDKRSERCFDIYKNKYNIPESAVFFIIHQVDEKKTALLDSYPKSNLIVIEESISDELYVQNILKQYYVKDSSIVFVLEKPTEAFLATRKMKRKFQIIILDIILNIETRINIAIGRINVYGVREIRGIPQNVSTYIINENIEGGEKKFPYIDVDFPLNLIANDKKTVYQAMLDSISDIPILKEWKEGKNFYKIISNEDESRRLDLSYEFIFTETNDNLESLVSLLLSLPTSEEVKKVQKSVNKYYDLMTDILLHLNNSFSHQFFKLKLYYISGLLTDEIFFEVYGSIVSIFEENICITDSIEELLVHYIKEKTEMQGTLNEYNYRTILGENFNNKYLYNLFLPMIIDAGDQHRIKRKNRTKYLGKRKPNEYFFSTILVSYNRRKTVFAAIDSFIANCYNKAELIIVDNNSSEELQKDIREYVAKYNNISVIILKNNFFGGARNYGIESAKGEYISFLDDDDRLAGTYYSTLEKYINEYKYDILRFNSLNFDESNKLDGTLSYSIVTESEHMGILDLETAELITHRKNLASVCFQCFRKDLLEGNQFLQNIFFEDNPFYFALLLRLNSIKYVPEAIYYRTMHGKSMMAKKVDDERISISELSVYCCVCDMLISLNETNVSNKNIIFDYIKEWAQYNMKNLGIVNNQIEDFLEDIKLINSRNYMEVINNDKIKDIIQRRYL